MKDNALSEVSVEEILTHYNLIVPEIQREYVWGYNTHHIVDVFLEDIKEGRSLKDNQTEDKKISLQKMVEDPTLTFEIKEALLLAIGQLQDISKEINIGFLYSYRPGYSDASKDKDLYLIDGQQRFTTLFLLLLYFATKENRLDDYFKLFKVNTNKGTLGFDYRVRSLTHHFFIELLRHTKTEEELLTIRDKTWFLTNFSHDITVNSICGDNNGEIRESVFEIFQRHFKEDKDSYFDFVKSKIKFWHFKTEETSQGEELYITMNSRGQQLTDNESIRAKLFDSDFVRKNPLKWSEKWEIWQDFFWKNRGQDVFSADQGFNEFLRWVCIIELIIQNIDAENKTLQNKPELIALYDKKSINIDYLELDVIDKYFNAIKYLFGDFQDYLETVLVGQYTLKVNLSQYFIKTDFIGGRSKEPLSLSSLFKLLPIVRYVSRFKNLDDVDKHQLFRFIKFVHNVNTDDNVSKGIRPQLINIIAIAEEFNLNGDITTLLQYEDKYKVIINEEQSNKLDYYSKVQDRITCEDYFWFAEQCGYNEGKIAHLIDIATLNNKNYDLVQFKLILECYQEFIDNQGSIVGNLIISDFYNQSYDRIEVSADFNSSKGLMNYLSKRSIFKESVSLADYLIILQQQFIMKYNDVESLINENSPRNQLYVYYILKRNSLIFDIAPWYWEADRINFGIYSSYPKCSTIFSNGYVYQFIKRKFVENSTFILDVHFKNLKADIIFQILNNWLKIK